MWQSATIFKIQSPDQQSMLEDDPGLAPKHLSSSTSPPADRTGKNIYGLDRSPVFEERAHKCIGGMGERREECCQDM